MLVNLIIVLVLVGAMLYVLQRVPLDATIKTIIQVVVIVAAVLYVLVKFVGPLLEGL